MQKSENYRHISGLEVSYIIYLKVKQNLENFCIETVIRDDSEIQNQFCKYQALTTRLSHLKNRAKRYQVIPQDDILSPNIRPGLAVEINVPLILIEYYLEPRKTLEKAAFYKAENSLSLSSALQSDTPSEARLGSRRSFNSFRLVISVQNLSIHGYICHTSTSKMAFLFVIYQRVYRK